MNITSRKFSVDIDKREATFSFASEAPVDRGQLGKEILSHAPGAMITKRLNNKSVPLLLNHDVTDQIGKVISHKQLEGVSYATVRFSSSQKAMQVLRDMNEGIRTEISVGYKIHKIERTHRAEPDNENDKDEWTVRSWEPMEISSVSIPADSGVGFRLSDAHIDFRWAIAGYKGEDGLVKSIRDWQDSNDRAILREVAREQMCSFTPFQRLLLIHGLATWDEILRERARKSLGY